MMKKAISYWSFVDKSVKERMALAKEIGYDGIELTVEETGPTGLESGPKDWEDIRKYADELGLALHSVATGLHWQYPITHDDPKVREKAIKIVEMELEMAKVFGADAILVVPGAVNVYWNPDFKQVQYDVAYERSLEAFMGLKKKAEELQIKIGIENVWNQFLISPLEMCDFIDKIDSPYVGAYLDVGNLIPYGLPEQHIRILGKRICKVHFKDYKNSIGGMEGFVDLLAGDVNWPEVMAAFKEIGYDGWYTAEVFGYRYYQDQLARNTCAAMDRIIKGC